MSCVRDSLTWCQDPLTQPHGENIAGASFTTEYLDSIYFLEQEDIRLLMPEPRRLHDYCSTPCMAMEMYADTHLQGKVSDQIFILSNTESKMSDMDNEEKLIISPSDSDRVILQRPAGSSETMNTMVDKGITSSVVTDPSLVMST